MNGWITRMSLTAPFSDRSSRRSRGFQFAARGFLTSRNWWLMPKRKSQKKTEY